ncbi:MAG: MtrB/PioB family outer membrane beta-barrel protein, partial [Acidobacteria bacterium]|nr:MtrB/PioB family outer membrane beta-barrel protein [Acidobacteriota bacterium]
TRTLYSSDAAGILRLSDTLRQQVQAGGTLASFTSQARLFDLKSRRDTAMFDVVLSPRRDLDVKFNLKTAKREGTQPWAVTLGGHSNVTEVAAPIDTRTIDATTDLEWSNARATLRAGYAGSWFDNPVESLILDNPLRFTDSATAPAQGRLALWPSSTLHSVTGAGSLKLAANTRATGNITIGTWLQNQPLLPFTTNTALRVLPLERATTDGEIRTVAMNYVVTSRPAPTLWFNARFRYYDLNNRTPELHIDERVRYDSGIVLSPGLATEAFNQTRHTLDLDTSFTPLTFTAFRVGYGREWVDRTHRIFEQTIEDVLRASADFSWSLGMARAIVERSVRRGTGDPEAELAAIGEQPAMRHFDIADRDRNRVTGLLQFTPLSVLAFSASAAYGHDDYRNSGFGLRDNKNRIVTVGADLTPGEIVGFGLTYAWEKYSALQNSRQATRAQFNDATRNWSIDSADRNNTLTATLDLLKVIPRIESRLSYSFTRSNYAYVYRVPAGSTLAAPVQLPPVRNELNTGMVDLRYLLTSKIRLGVTYQYDGYRVDDFALNPGTINRIDLPGMLALGYVYRPYTANTVWTRLIYLF